MEDPLNANERAVLDAFSVAWNGFVRLPELHPADMQEVMAHIHAIQNIILSRPAARYENWRRLENVQTRPLSGDWLERAAGISETEKLRRARLRAEDHPDSWQL